MLADAGGVVDRPLSSKSTSSKRIEYSRTRVCSRIVYTPIAANAKSPSAPSVEPTAMTVVVLLSLPWCARPPAVVTAVAMVARVGADVGGTAGCTRADGGTVGAVMGGTGAAVGP